LIQLKLKCNFSGKQIVKGLPNREGFYFLYGRLSFIKIHSPFPLLKATFADLLSFLNSKSVNTFEALGIEEGLLQSIKTLGFTQPTPIQEKAIPVLLQGTKDFIGLAQTGTGKTAAFGLPKGRSVSPGINCLPYTGTLFADYE
jgi:DEAD/DEAH box helicase